MTVRLSHQPKITRESIPRLHDEIGRFDAMISVIVDGFAPSLVARSLIGQTRRRQPRALELGGQVCGPVVASVPSRLVMNNRQA
jgi:hypothetical protein